ncbi:MAG: tetratricopeptide repeat protein [Verrucomicrobiales bacterium]|nr:tetratricopeptide repeat protein [Verrucomicrobiales bacterium]
MNRFALTIAFLLPVSLLSGNEPLPIDALWKSEAFRKAYTASYGIDSKIEPLINEDESFYLAEAAKLMAEEDRPAAIQKLLDSDISEESPAILFSLGNFHYEEGNQDVAIDYYNKAIALFPNFRDAHRNVAMLEIQKEQYDEAETHLKRAVELGSQEGLTYGLLAFCHTQKKRLQAALSAYRMAQVTMPDEIQWKLGEAHTLQAIGDAAHASAIYGELIEKFPSDVYLWINRANTLVQTEKPVEAIAHLEMADRIKELAPSNRVYLGQMYMGQSLYDSAMENFTSAIATKGVDLAAAVGCLGLLNNHRKWALAKTLGEKLFEVYFEEIEKPENIKYYSIYQRTMAIAELETGNSKAGAKRVEALLSKDPLDGDALMLLAKFREEQNRQDDAIVLLEQAAVVPEHRAAALFAHGKILVNRFQYKEALKLLEESNHIDPKDSLKQYIEAIRELL